MFQPHAIIFPGSRFGNDLGNRFLTVAALGEKVERSPEDEMISRRQMLALAGTAPAWMAKTASAAPVTGVPRMGGTPTAFSMHSSAGRTMGVGGAGRGAAPGAGAPGAAPAAARGGGARFDVFEYCHTLGLGGAEIGMPPMDPEANKALRAKVEAYNMYLVCGPALPRDAGGVAAFDAQVKACKDAGASLVHAAMTQRRYEEFATRTAADFKASFERNQASVQLAEPVLRKYQMRLANENHKGWRSAEHAAWMKRLGSEWVGVCLDFGNNIALCEDPMDTLKTLLPYTFYAHIKDMAVQDYEDGFLLSEVPMGDGFLDLKGMVGILREKDPNMLFGLEMITREPLKVPVYNLSYWTTFDDSYSPLPGRDLAHVLDLVRKNKPKKPLPHVDGLTAEQRVKLEEDLNAQCIAYAHQNLDM
jgi:sugar phosphate isomerase/epimerase